VQPEYSTAESRYLELERHREPALRRARDCSLLTIPALIPENGFNDSSALPVPYQSLGARGVNSLANKLALALLPPSATFFRLSMNGKLKKQLQAVNPAAVSQFDEALSNLEQEVLKGIEKRQVRVHATEAFKHLIVGGNVLLHFSKEGKTKVIPLTQYVVDRDTQGNVLEIVVKETISPNALPPGTREKVMAKINANAKKETEVDLFTRVWLEDGQYKVVQECKCETLDGSTGSYPNDKLPWLALRWTRVDGQDYGRGHCEEYMGDLSSLDKLEKSVLECSAIMARLIPLVNPNGTTSMEDLVNAENGQPIHGNKDDVHMLQADKYADLQVVLKEIDRMENRLNYAFLMTNAIQRQAERVTAEEVRIMANELENTLGGVYSVMSTEFQMPMVVIVMADMQRTGDLPLLPKDGVIPTIVTGLDALGRSHELMRLDQFINDSIQKFQDRAYEYLNMGEYFSRRAAALGIDKDNLIRSEEEVQAARQQAQRAQMMQAAVPNAVKAIGDNINQPAATTATTIMSQGEVVIPPTPPVEPVTPVTPAAPVTPATPPPPAPPRRTPKFDISKYETEFTSKGSLSEDSYKELATKHSLSKEAVDEFISLRQERQKANTTEVLSAVGGETGFAKLSEWAAQNLSDTELEAYNTQVQSGNAAVIKLALGQLQTRYQQHVRQSPRPRRRQGRFVRPRSLPLVGRGPRGDA
jgi:hypothetical protein